MILKHFQKKEVKKEENCLYVKEKLNDGELVNLLNMLEIVITRNMVK